MNYKTAIVEFNWLRDHNHGWGNGYVIIPKQHPFYGIDYMILNNYVNVHGGLTYSEFCDGKNIHRFKLEPDDIGKWIIGFDTAHSSDTYEKWHKGAVQAETDMLLSQVISCVGMLKENVT